MKHYKKRANTYLPPTRMELFRFDTFAMYLFVTQYFLGVLTELYVM